MYTVSLIVHGITKQCSHTLCTSLSTKTLAFLSIRCADDCPSRIPSPIVGLCIVIFIHSHRISRCKADRWPGAKLEYYRSPWVRTYGQYRDALCTNCIKAWRACSTRFCVVYSTGGNARCIIGERDEHRHIRRDFILETRKITEESDSQKNRI